MGDYNPVISIVDFAQAVKDEIWFVGFIRDDKLRHWNFYACLDWNQEPRIAIHESRLELWQEWHYKKLTQVEDIILLVRARAHHDEPKN